MLCRVGSWMLFGALCALGASLSNTVQAQVNILENPGFQSGIEDWENPPDRPVEWQDEDASDNPGSGSVKLSYTGPSNGSTSTSLIQCITATPMVEYRFGGYFRVPEGQPEGTEAQIFVHAHTTGNCNDDVAAQVFDLGSASDRWEFRSEYFTTEEFVTSFRVSIGLFKPGGESADAFAEVDEVFVEERYNRSNWLRPAMSASWYNPDESGHGIMIHILDGQSAWMCWFAFDSSGDRAWICALGTIDGDTIEFADAFTVSGGAFPPNFDPGQIAENPWGSITVTFTGCNTGTMTWTTSAAGFSSGTMPIERLTPLWGASCS